MKNIKPESFIFDMDGTIVDTAKDIANCVNYSLRFHGLKERTYDEIVSYLGNGSVLLIERAIGEENIDLFQSVYDVYYKKYLSEFCVLTSPYDGLIDSLHLAKEKGIRLFVYTNKPDAIAQEVLRKCFPEGMFELLVGIPERGKTKPDPVAFFKATESHPLDYSRTMYFGDSTTDLETATNLGCKGIYSVLWGYQTKAKIMTSDIKPTAFLTDPKQIMDVIEERL